MTGLMALPEDVLQLLPQILHSECIVTLITLTKINKFFYKTVTSYAKEAKISRRCMSYDYVCKGYLKLLKEDAKYGVRIATNISEVAALHGHLDILKWIKKHNHHWSNKIIRNAIIGGYLEVVKWVHKCGYHWEADYLCLAAHYGRLEILEWYSQRYCLTHETSICTHAYINKHLDILLWAKAKGFEYAQLDWCINKLVEEKKLKR
jgi:hypothetical protein